MQSCARWRSDGLGLSPLTHFSGPDADWLAAAIVANPVVVARAINQILGVRADNSGDRAERALSAHVTVRRELPSGAARDEPERHRVVPSVEKV